MLTVVALLFFSAFSQSSEFVSTGWAVARSPHFEVYSQAGSEPAKLTLTQFEELRSFFEHYHFVQTGSGLQEKGPLRVIEFSSRKEYEPFQSRAAADAYYNGTPDRDYIVMPRSGAGAFGIAAHEYSHFVLHSSGLNLPAWLSEGLAELFSTVTITSRQCEFGGPLPARVQALHHHSWLTAAELFASEANSPSRQTRDGAAVFYAESWAIADMLTSSPAYAPRFQDFILILNSGKMSSQQAVTKVFMKSADALLTDAQDWIAHARSARHAFASPAPENFQVAVVPIAELQAKAVLADLLFANQEYDRAEILYKESLRQAADPQIFASLGAVELRKGNRDEALQCWRKAIDQGLVDANLCYRYALVAEEMNLPSDQVEHALEQAVVANPRFDDARYKLALLESNAGNYAAAVSQLKAMSKPQPQRAFAYWTALSYALSELGRREKAESAAREAMRAAGSKEEQARAAELVYVAKTDLAVRFTRDSSGNPQLVTTRVPHGTTEFNPFVETGDHIRVAAGTLREVQCSEGKLTGFVIESNTGLLTLAVPDPTHVLVRNGPSEFTCGDQPAKGVKLEYAAAPESDKGLLRGIEFQ